MVITAERLLNRILRRGTLRAADDAGREHVFGDGGPPFASVRLHGSGAGIALNPVLKTAEAFMDGRLEMREGTDIASFLDLVCLNLAWSPDNPNFQIVQTGLRVDRLLAQINFAGRSRRNVAHHYDLKDALFDLFLDEDRQYSCAYFTDPAMSLDAAQAAKRAHIRRKLLLTRPDLRVLDIGSGWGGLALEMAREDGARVTGVTLSENQIATARQRAEAAGLSARARFEFVDYRNATGRFDRIVSVGMFEHVGKPHYRQFFETAARLMEDDGVMLLHTIGRAPGPGALDPFTKKYIFPGSHVPTLGEMTPHIERAGFFITDVETWRLHYAYTLTHWYERCLARKAEIVALYDERFFRMWTFYLAMCRMIFKYLGVVVYQLQLSRRVDAVPLTRDYLYR